LTRRLENIGKAGTPQPLKLPADGEPRKFKDLYDLHGVEFLKRKKRISLVRTHSAEQDELLILLARHEPRGLVRVPHDPDQCMSLLGEYGAYIHERENAVREYIGDRTADEDMQEKIYLALRPMIWAAET